MRAAALADALDRAALLADDDAHRLVRQHEVRLGLPLLAAALAAALGVHRRVMVVRVVVRVRVVVQLRRRHRMAVLRGVGVVGVGMRGGAVGVWVVVRRGVCMGMGVGDGMGGRIVVWHVVVRAGGAVHQPRVRALRAQRRVRQRDLVRAVVPVLRHLGRDQRHRAQLALAAAADVDHALAKAGGLVDVGHRDLRVRVLHEGVDGGATLADDAAAQAVGHHHRALHIGVLALATLPSLA
mmetsp:Transcript_45158/g.115536  ORF Transcript_45158/g.115536 Transcript_45158/m.115536 type:complete len:239 (+) Transcript_45158:370-1086(+)